MPTPLKVLRREARAAALQMLYAVEMNGQPADQVEGWYAENHPSPLPVRQFAHELLAGALAHREPARALYARHLQEWRPERLSVIDRCLLWMSASELLGERRVPPAVLVDEYIHLARRFSQPGAMAWIHAVLDAMARELRPKRAESGD